MKAAEILELDRELELLGKLLARGQANDLAAVLQARRRQVEQGHTEEADNDLTPLVIANRLLDEARAGRDVLHPGDRYNLEVAYTRTARVGGMCLALMRRIRRELELEAAKAPPAPAPEWPLK